MSGLLASKWAHAEPVKEPRASQETTMPPKKPQVPAANGLLRSKWAHAPNDPDHPINAKAPVAKTPAYSKEAGHSRKPSFSGKHDRNGKKHSPKQNVPVADLSSSLNRVDLGKARKAETKKTNASAPPKQERNSSRGSEFEDDREPMTQAGSVLAARLGMPSQKETAKVPAAKKQEVRASRTEAPARTYLTPKQKKLNEEKLKQEALSREQAEKDAKLKAEVQSLFEKMSDKSTSWADLEDE